MNTTIFVMMMFEQNDLFSFSSQSAGSIGFTVELMFSPLAQGLLSVCTNSPWLGLVCTLRPLRKLRFCVYQQKVLLKLGPVHIISPMKAFEHHL